MLFSPQIVARSKRASAASGGGTDPPFSSVKLLLGFNGTPGPPPNPGFADESAGAHSLFTSSNITISSAQSVFGGTSLLCASSSALLIFNDSVDFSFGTGPYTIEFRIYPTAAATMALVLKDGGANNFDINLSSGAIALRHNSGAVASGGSIGTNVWSAVCVERGTADKCRIYVDGAMVASGTSSANIGTGGFLFVACRNSGITPLQGHMDELRITKGVAIYDSDSGYTVATSAFPRS